MRYMISLKATALLLIVMLGGCSFAAKPDWQALYSERLGQPVKELDGSTIDQEYLDPATGALTRVAWARLQNNEMVLLGLPPHGLKTEEVIDRTVVLSQDEWQEACREGLGEEEIWGWEMSHGHPGNSLRIYVNNERDSYCEFFYLPEGWELRTVYSQGILKPFH